MKRPPCLGFAPLPARPACAFGRSAADMPLDVEAAMRCGRQRPAAERG
jgi:hypothetical protein